MVQELKKYTVKVIHVYRGIKAEDEEQAVDIAISMSYGEAQDCQFDVEED